MVLLHAHGLAADIPGGWDARTTARAPVPASGAAGVAAAAVPPLTLLHTASFPLPAGIGDFGSGAVEVMRVSDAFVAVFEHAPASAGTALFGHRGRPNRFIAGDFNEDALQRPQLGQVGLQRFFTLDDRAWCVYVVLGHRVAALRRLAAVNDLVASLRVG